MILKTLVRIFWIGLLSTGLIAAAPDRSGKASATNLQTADTEWSTPSNLSQSGGANTPRLVVDSTGRANLLWLDEYAGVLGAPGLMAAQGADGEWSSPNVLELPFGKYLAGVKLAAAPNGLIYAAWIDDQGSLYTSQVSSKNFAQPGSWNAAQVLALSVADFDLATASDGNAHFVFVRAEDSSDFPAGVYSLRTIGTGTMTAPRLLAASPYFRGLTADEVEVSVAAGDASVYAAWELPSQEQVFAAVSSDDGMRWSEARLVDSRQAGDGSGVGPSQPRLRALEGAQAGTALLLWQAGHQGGNCAQYAQATRDGGQTWSEAARLPEPFDKSCAQELQLLAIPGGGILAFAETASGVNLLVWDSASDPARWSDAQAQNALSGFTNPVTFRAASLDCRQAGMSPAGVLVVAGCEGETAGETPTRGDIWLLERSLGDVSEWFPAPAAEPLWSAAAILDSAEDGLNTPVLAADSSGRLHTLWSRQNDSGLYYAQWDGSRWTQAQAVLSSPGGAPQALTVVVHPDGLLAAVWSDPAAGGLFYSLAPAAQASEAANWLAPQDLPLSGTPTGPQAVALPDGRLALAYALAFNEGRGIYLVESKAPPQPGQLVEWNPPQPIFDAAAAGWESLGDPRLVLAGDGSLQALWTRTSLPPSGRVTGLYSSRGQPGAEGFTWSEPEEVRQGQVVWSLMLAAGEELHRVWQEPVGGQLALFHQVSLDNGQTWSSASRPGGMTGAGLQLGLAGLALAPDGAVNLVQINALNRPGTAGESGGQRLLRWGWQADPGLAGAWSELESQDLTGLEEALSMSLAGFSQGLGLLYSGVETPDSSTTGEGGSGGTQAAAAGPDNLFYTERRLEGGLPTTNQPGVAGVQTTVTPTANSQADEPTPAATPTTGPTPTATFNPNPASNPLPGLGGMTGAVLIGLVAALALAGLAFFLVQRGRRRWERQQKESRR